MGNRKRSLLAVLGSGKSIDAPPSPSSVFSVRRTVVFSSISQNVDSFFAVVVVFGGCRRRHRRDRGRVSGRDPRVLEGIWGIWVSGGIYSPLKLSRTLSDLAWIVATVFWLEVFAPSDALPEATGPWQSLAWRGERRYE